MPVRLLTDAERERLSGFPTEVPTEDLHGFFTLTGRDRGAVPATSAPANRLGFALSLCAVRYLGFCPEDLSGRTDGAVWYVAQQLGLAPEAIHGYPERGQTRTEHLKRIYVHLGYRRPTSADLRGLFAWLVERALEHDDPALLVAFLSEAHAELTDEVVDLFDACLGHADSKAKRELDEFRKGSARTTNEKVALFHELALVLLDPTVDDPDVRAAVHEKVGSPDDLLDMVEEAERLMRPPDDNHLDFFAARYPYVRRFAQRFLSSFSFRSNGP